MPNTDPTNTEANAPAAVTRLLKIPNTIAGATGNSR